MTATPDIACSTCGHEEHSGDTRCHVWFGMGDEQCPCPASSIELPHTVEATIDTTAQVDLLPAERMALTVALAQLRRGEDPTPNVAAALVFALARVAGVEP